MYDRPLVLEIIRQILEAISRIERRCQGVTSPNDFVSSDDGLDRLDGVCMMLIAIGEGCKHLDKITGRELLRAYSQVDTNYRKQLHRFLVDGRLPAPLFPWP